MIFQAMNFDINFKIKLAIFQAIISMKKMSHMKLSYPSI